MLFRVATRYSGGGKGWWWWKGMMVVEGRWPLVGSDGIDGSSAVIYAGLPVCKPRIE